MAYKLWGDADYVQPGLLSHTEQVRLDGMQLGPLLAEVATTSTKHRDAASKRAASVYLGVQGVEQNGRQRWVMQFSRKGLVPVYKLYDGREEAAREYDALAWEQDSWCATNTCCVCAH